MDRTLRRAGRRSRRRSGRNHGAWRRFAPDGTHCRYCPHDGSKHLISSGQPHFYRPATEQKRRTPGLLLYRHTPKEGGPALVRRIVVANRAELITAFCTACAKELGTAQVLCYQRTLAVGEAIGFDPTERTGGRP